MTEHYRRRSDSLTQRFFMTCFIMALAFLVYERAAPIIADFEIKTAIKQDEKVVIYGTFNKLRNCRFHSLFVSSTIEGIEYPLIFEFSDVANAPDENKSTRQTARQFFGPWTINLIQGADNLNLRVLHSCDFGIFRATELIKGYAL